MSEGRPKTLSVAATWEGGYRARMAVRDHELVADEPVAAGGGDGGPQPSELFLAALASCFTLAIYHVGKKRDIHLTDLSVRATGDYEGPKFARLRLEVTSSMPRDVLDGLVERAKSVCYVSNTLRAVSDVEVVVATGDPEPAA
ncbi:MAG: OsmC family protein [Actinomycetota bacterium]|nr:OsmC family protein [Actinomycetota bacterium]